MTKIRIFQSVEEVIAVFETLPLKSKLIFYYKWAGENEIQEIWVKNTTHNSMMRETALGRIKHD